VRTLVSRLKDLARQAPGAARELARQLDSYRRQRAADRADRADRAVRSSARGVHAAQAVAPPAPPATVEEPPRPTEVRWELRSQAELVDHLERHYHANLRRDLPALVELAQRVERARRDDPALPADVYAPLVAFASSLEGHMYQEETKLFPTIRTAARGGELDMPIRMMERDHDDHADELERLRALVGEPPASAPAAWKELHAALATLADELRQHVYLENHVLFARALGER
jgi:regulator of cell morphogenesis and NO signaling